jgi:hypothetical protein
MKRMVSMLCATLAIMSVFGLSRPARAEDVIGFPEGVSYDLVRAFICVCESEMFFKCPKAATLLSLLNAAEKEKDYNRRQMILKMAADCACLLSREIDYRGSPNPSAPNYNPGYGKPYYTLGFLNPYWQDLAQFHHELFSQIYGRVVCAAIHCLLTGDTGPCYIVVPSGAH